MTSSCPPAYLLKVREVNVQWMCLIMTNWRSTDYWKTGRNRKVNHQKCIPSRELTYPTVGKENHLQMWFLMGYVGSPRGVKPCKQWDKLPTSTGWEGIFSHQPFSRLASSTWRVKVIVGSVLSDSKSKQSNINHLEMYLIWVFPKIVVPPNHPFY